MHTTCIGLRAARWVHVPISHGMAYNHKTYHVYCSSHRPKVNYIPPTEFSPRQRGIFLLGGALLIPAEGGKREVAKQLSLYTNRSQYHRNFRNMFCQTGLPDDMATSNSDR